MLILVTNDDGITAAGIKALVESLKIGDVVVAPERERSAVGHAITMHKPLRANRENFSGGNRCMVCKRYTVRLRQTGHRGTGQRKARPGVFGH